MRLRSRAHPPASGQVDAQVVPVGAQVKAERVNGAGDSAGLGRAAAGVEAPSRPCALRCVTSIAVAMCAWSHAVRSRRKPSAFPRRRPFACPDAREAEVERRRAALERFVERDVPAREPEAPRCRPAPSRREHPARPTADPQCSAVVRVGSVARNRIGSASTTAGATAGGAERKQGAAGEPRSTGCARLESLTARPSWPPRSRGSGSARRSRCPAPPREGCAPRSG